MTNKEAIKFLKEPRMWEWLNVAQQIALDMAIDALSQQPCEDCINRSEAIKYLNTNMAWYDENGEMADSDKKLKAITDLINGVPSVQPKTGHWIEKTNK